MTQIRAPRSDESVAILGAGALGMTLALRLAQAGMQVTLFEAAEEIGGLTASFDHKTLTWDRFYHVVDQSDSALIDLIDELALRESLRWHRTRTLLFDGADCHSLDDLRDYLQLPIISFADKIRLGANIVYAAMRKDRAPLENISARAWLERWSGKQAYRAVWAPLLRSKLGKNADRVSAAFIWAVIRRFYGARQGAARTEAFGFIDGGYAKVLDRFGAHLRSLGVDIRTGTVVQKLEAPRAGCIVLHNEGGFERFSRVVITFASPIAARLLESIAPDAAEAHRTVSYQGVVCQSLLLTRPLGGAYMTYITDDNVPFTTVIEMTALTGTRPFEGQHLVYLPRYVPSDDPLLDAPDEELGRLLTGGLNALYPDFDPSQVRTSRIARARHVLALPTVGYGDALPPLETGVPGLAVCNSAQILDASLSVNAAISLANRAASTLLSDA